MAAAPNATPAPTRAADTNRRDRVDAGGELTTVMGSLFQWAGLRHRKVFVGRLGGFLAEYLTAQRREREFTQAVTRVDGGAETEHVGRAGRIGDDVANVAAAVLPGDDGRRVAPCLAQLGGHLHDGDRPTRADIER